MNSRSDHSSKLMVLGACAALAACDPFATAAYQGEPLLTLSGTVSSALADQSPELQLALAYYAPKYDLQTNAYTNQLFFVPVEVSGEFPAQFELHVYEPPSDDAMWNAETPNDVDGDGFPNDVEEQLGLDYNVSDAQVAHASLVAAPSFPSDGVEVPVDPEAGVDDFQFMIDGIGVVGIAPISVTYLGSVSDALRSAAQSQGGELQEGFSVTVTDLAAAFANEDRSDCLNAGFADTSSPLQACHAACPAFDECTEPDGCPAGEAGACRDACDDDACGVRLDDQHELAPGEQISFPIGGDDLIALVRRYRDQD